MIGIPMLLQSPKTPKTIYYLLYANYGNSVIASSDINRFKYKLFTTIFQYGPTWEKRLDIQQKLRSMPDEELFMGSTQIYNHSFNPSSAPSSASMEELPTINEQNTQKNKRDKLTAYSNLLMLLETDVTSAFIDKFKKLFLTIVNPELPLYYETPILDEPNTGEYDKWFKGYPDTLYGNFRNKTFADIYPSYEDFIIDFLEE